MKYITLIIVGLTVIFCSCNDSLKNKIDLLGYTTGSNLDDNWEVLSDYDVKGKILQCKLDTNITASSIADTIWSIRKKNINDDESSMFVNDINKQPYTNTSMLSERNIGKQWNCLEYQWVDSVSGDEISLMKCRNKKQEEYGSWTLEISNKEILVRLKHNHDPSYKNPLKIVPE